MKVEKQDKVNRDRERKGERREERGERERKAVKRTIAERTGKTAAKMQMQGESKTLEKQEFMKTLE